jgi:malate permease and related proteins
LFISDQLMLGVLVVLSAMPTATNATMMSLEYGGNERLASKTVFITTLFSIATIPLLVFLLLS